MIPVNDQTLHKALNDLQDRIGTIFPRVKYELKLEYFPSAHGCIMIRGGLSDKGRWMELAGFYGLGAGLDTLHGLTNLDDQSIKRIVVQAYAKLEEAI